MINLEQDFLKFETDGTTAYYGYSRILDYGTQSNNWSIRQVLGTGSTLDVYWSNEKKFDFVSKWDDRVYYFQDPAIIAGSWSTIGVTWSATTGQDSFNEYADLQVQWDLIRGVDKYGVRIKDEDGKLLTEGGEYLYNTYVPNPYTKVVESEGPSDLKFNFRGTLGVTYSVQIEAFNGWGSVTSDFQFYVI
jgi:hypothetical protein